MRSEWEANRAIDRYADLVRRVCMIHLKNHADTEDIFQTVFLKYVTGTTEFESEEHEKAWFIRVTINACKDLLRRFFRSRTVSLDDLIHIADRTPECPLDDILPKQLKPAERQILIWRFEDRLSHQEIADRLGISEAACRSRVFRAVARCRQYLEP